MRQKAAPSAMLSERSSRYHLQKEQDREQCITGGDVAETHHGRTSQCPGPRDGLYRATEEIQRSRLVANAGLWLAKPSRCKSRNVRISGDAAGGRGDRYGGPQALHPSMCPFPACHFEGDDRCRRGGGSASTSGIGEPISSNRARRQQ